MSPSTRDSPCSLRERRDVHLEVDTSILHDSSDDSEFPSPIFRPSRSRKLHSMGHHNNYPHSPSLSSSSSSPSSEFRHKHRPSVPVLLHLHEIIPSACIALSCSSFYPPALASRYGYTHIVNIAPYPNNGNTVNNTITLHTDPALCIQTLTLFLSPPPPPPPPSSHPNSPSERSSSPLPTPDFDLLTSSQLLAARDFLTLALPYSTTESSPSSSPIETESTADKVKVLITATITVTNSTSIDSTLAAVEEDDSESVRLNGGIGGCCGVRNVMAVVFCYLAFISGMDVWGVKENVEKEKSVQNVWKSVRFGGGLGRRRAGGREGKRKEDDEEDAGEGDVDVVEEQVMKMMDGVAEAD